MALNLLPQVDKSVLAGAIISIMLNPVLFTLLEKYLDKTETLDEQTLEEVLEDEKQVPVDICNHALLVGFGRVGSLLGEKLMAQGIPLVVVETSRTRVDELRERGISAVLGNAANEEIMELAHLDCARWLLLTIPNGYEAGEIVASAREKCPNIEIIARAHYDDEVDYIIDRGANQVVMGGKLPAPCYGFWKRHRPAKWSPADVLPSPAGRGTRLPIPVRLFQAVLTLRQAAG